MRTNRRTRQKMYYALKVDSIPVYELDEDGNIKYRIVDGDKVPIETGETKDGYSSPEEFNNSITSDLKEDEISAFGGENVSLAKMTYPANRWPFKSGTLIWKETTPPEGEVDPDTADYIVVSVKSVGKHYWKCILRRVSK